MTRRVGILFFVIVGLFLIQSEFGGASEIRPGDILFDDALPLRGWAFWMRLE